MNKFLNGVKTFAKKVWEYLKLAKIEYLVIIAAIAVDLVSKAIIQATMYEGETLVLIPNFLEFYFTYNKAAAFSFDFGLSSLVGKEGVTIAFIIVTFLSLGLFGFVLYKIRERGLWPRIAFALIIGGAIGNLYDRIAFSMVRDFIRIVYFGYDIPALGGTGFAVFNIADACLVIGVIMYVFYVLFLENKDRLRMEKAQKTAQVQSENTDGQVVENIDNEVVENVEITENPTNVAEKIEQNEEEQ